MASTAIAAATGTCDCGGALGVDAMRCVTVLYQCDGGLLHSFTEDIPVQMTLEAPYSPEARVTLNCLSVQVAGGGRTPELQFVLEATAERYETRQLQLVSDVAAGGTPPPQAGILIYCADAGDTLWSVGKRFAVPLAALSEWNGALSEPLQEGQQILLMK